MQIKNIAKIFCQGFFYIGPKGGGNPPSPFKICMLYIQIFTAKVHIHIGEHALDLIHLRGLEHAFWLTFPPLEKFLEKSLPAMWYDCTI